MIRAPDEYGSGAGTPLFDYVPAQRHSDTSKAAAERIKPRATTMRERVLRELRLAGEQGLTDEQMQVRLKMNPSTQRPRRIELLKGDLVFDSGRTRKTRSGSKATVWVARKDRGHGKA